MGRIWFIEEPSLREYSVTLDVPYSGERNDYVWSSFMGIFVLEDFDVPRIGEAVILPGKISLIDSLRALPLRVVDVQRAPKLLDTAPYRTPSAIYPDPAIVCLRFEKDDNDLNQLVYNQLLENDRGPGSQRRWKHFGDKVG